MLSSRSIDSLRLGVIRLRCRVGCRKVNNERCDITHNACYLPRTSELPLVLGPNSIGEKRQPLTPLPAVFGRLPRPSLSTEGAGVRRLLAPRAKWKWGGSLAAGCSRLVSWALGCCMLISAPTDLPRR